MSFRLFTVRPSDAEALAELNAFVSGHRVVRIDRHMIRPDNDPAVLFIVEFASDGAPTTAKKTPQVDYRELLTDAEFEVFSALRDIRRDIARELGRPVYTVFTNSELAAMVQQRVHTREGLLGMPGIGEGRVDQHGERFFPTLSAWSAKQSCEGQP